MVNTLLKFSKSILNFKIISTLLVVVLVANLVLFGCLAPKRQPAEALIPDIIGGIAKVIGTIWDFIKPAIDWAKDAFHWIAPWAQWAMDKYENSQSWIAKALRIAAYILMQQLLNMITNQIIEWINGGGKPRFITDWKGFLQTAADRAAGAFLNQLAGINLCEPFSLDLQISLFPTTNFPEDVSCSFSEMGHFFDDFHNEGWRGWVQLTEPKNNFFGTYFKGIDQRMSAKAAAKKSAENEGIASTGFLGARCDEEVANAGKCELGDIITPGESLSFVTNKALTQDIETNQASFADLTDSLGTFAPFVIAIGSALVNKLMKDGLAMMSGDDNETIARNRIQITPPDPSGATAKISDNIAFGQGLIEQQKVFKQTIDDTYIPSLKEQLALVKKIYVAQFTTLENVTTMLEEECSPGILYSLEQDTSQEDKTFTTIEESTGIITTTTKEYLILEIDKIGSANIFRETISKATANGRSISSESSYTTTAITPEKEAQVDKITAQIADAEAKSLAVIQTMDSVNLYMDFIQINQAKFEDNSYSNIKTTDGKTIDKSNSNSDPEKEKIEKEAQTMYIVAIEKSQIIANSSATSLEDLVTDTQEANTDLAQEPSDIKLSIGVTTGGYGPDTGLKGELATAEGMLKASSSSLNTCLHPEGEGGEEGGEGIPMPPTPF